MPQKSNSFERFWKELKRRKVVHVITVYAAAAFVILQLVDMVSQPLHFPEWTQGFIIVLLCIGFIIAVLLSWVYDITPSGVKKTKPASAVKHTDHITTPTSSGWKIATYVSGVIIIALVAFNFIHRRNLNADISKLEKSIAVLPFRNDSPDTTYTYFLNNIMERITTNLQMIKELRVIGRGSVEQYRNNKTKSNPEIAKELDVSYIIEGSGQRYGNSFSLVVQLIKAKGKETHLWAKPYDQEIKEVNDYIRIQSEIAREIATELKAVITPLEKQLIERTPTTSLTADDFYQRGREEHAKFQLLSGNMEALAKAEILYKRALEYDPTFAQAYTGLAAVYWDKHYLKEYFSENFMDSVLILTNTALFYNDQLDEAYTLRGNYYHEKGLPEQAIKEFDKALKINPNSWEAYYLKADLSSDMLTSIKNLQKAVTLNHGSKLPDILREIGEYYFDTGFPEKAHYCVFEAFKLDGDSVNYLYYLGYFEQKAANSEKSVEFLERCYKLDSTNINTLWLLGQVCMSTGQIEQSLKYYKEFETRRKLLGTEYVFPGATYHRIGYAYWKNGYKKESEYYFDKQLEECNNQIKSDRPWSQKNFTYYDIAGIYAFRGDKEKAYANLRILDKRESEPLWMVSLIKNDPLFNSIRNEPEFQNIVKDMDAKYQAEHERVRKWLEEQGML
jgi:TolB-like protein/Tfp pilus assembly protein PilF